ncbi:restriction endonuclease subunit S [Fibrobacter sp.]|uniref:restriction endonuclease subunit S n=1 Tax=Fibrobacter sp. TaxID=35828 RepID=UPI0025BF7DD1|nr:restriction endonuclease subunit S [Fibrobacter sp.]MCI6436906.1 restriction endonuclease subunit S [Fibrobacter sp.]
MKETKFKQTLVQTKEGSRHCEEHSDVAIQGGFKMTEVGMIPSDWEVKTLGELFDFSAGGDLQKESFSEYPSGTIKWPIYSNSLENKGLYGYTSNPRYRANCVTITGRGSLGHAEYRREAFDAIVRLLVLSPKQHVDCYFVSETINFRVPFVFESTGVPQLTAPQAAKSKIPLPPTIEEQQRIANALSDVDTLIANLEKLIAKKKNIKQGAMQQLLTGKKRLPGFGLDERTGSRPTDERRKECHSERSAKREVEESDGYKMTELGMIPSDWEVKKLSSVCTIIMGQSPDSKYYNEKEGTPLIQGNADIENRETFVRFYTTQITKKGLKGDLILTVRAPVGSVAKATFDCCLGRGVCALRNANDFLYQYLIYIEKEWAKRSAGSTFDSIKSDELSATLVVVPSSKEEQTAIANVLSDMDTEISALETKLAKYRTLKTGMMQQLLTGKIRLV